MNWLNSEKSKTIITSLLVVGSIALIVHLLLPSSEEILCWKQKEYSNMDFNSVVVDKFIDNKNHNYRTVKFKSLINSSRHVIILDFDKSNLFEIISTGDTIKKTRGSLNFIINDNRSIQVTVSANCPD